MSTQEHNDKPQPVVEIKSGAKTTEDRLRLAELEVAAKEIFAGRNVTISISLGYDLDAHLEFFEIFTGS